MSGPVKQRVNSFPMMFGYLGVSIHSIGLFVQRPPAVQGNTDYLVDLLAKCDIDMAMIVQSATHAFDHSYVRDAMGRFPGKFIGCLLANPDDVSRMTPLSVYVIRWVLCRVDVVLQKWRDWFSKTDSVVSDSIPTFGQMGRR